MARARGESRTRAPGRSPRRRVEPVTGSAGHPAGLDERTNPAKMLDLTFAPAGARRPESMEHRDEVPGLELGPALRAERPHEAASRRNLSLSGHLEARL